MRGKPNPPGYDEEMGPEALEWYSPDNLRRVWDGLRDGEAMTCHQTDLQAKFVHQGEPETPSMCMGAFAVQAAHLQYFSTVVDMDSTPKKRAMKIYQKKAGEMPMTEDGLTGIAMGIHVGVTSLLGGLRVPREIDLQWYDDLSVPWTDPAIDTMKKILEERKCG
jgi:hypothetical protein